RHARGREALDPREAEGRARGLRRLGAGPLAARRARARREPVHAAQRRAHRARARRERPLRAALPRLRPPRPHARLRLPVRAALTSPRAEGSPGVTRITNQIRGLRAPTRYDTCVLARLSRIKRGLLRPRYAHIGTGGSMGCHAHADHTAKAIETLQENLAQLLHDGPLQDLVATKHMAASLAKLGELGHVDRAQRLAELQAHADAAIERMRELIRTFADPPSSAATLTERLETLVDDFREGTGLEVRVHVKPQHLRFAPDLGDVLYRAV